MGCILVLKKKRKEDNEEKEKEKGKGVKKLTLKEKIKKWWEEDDKNGNDTDETMSKGKKVFKVIVYFLLIFVLITIIDVVQYRNNLKDIKRVTYQEYELLLEQGKIDTVYYSEGVGTMRFTLYNYETKDMDYEERREYKYDNEYYRIVEYPAGENFRENLLKQGVHIEEKNFLPVTLTLWTLGFSLMGVFVTIAFIIIILMYMSQMITKGIAVNDFSKDTGVTFADVIGHDEIKKDLSFYVQLLKAKKDSNELEKKKAESFKGKKKEADDVQEEKGKGIETELPKGCLFTGPPGTGKTLLAKAIAGEANVPFFYVNASNFIEMYVGLGAKRVRELFAKARKESPCIIFIDEIDAIGGSRNANETSTSEHRQTLNALLQELDGFNSEASIFVIAATNLPETLDGALTRAGRFDRQIAINPPQTVADRQKMFEFYLKDKPIAEDLDLHTLAKQTTGMTGADVSAIVKEACLIAMAKQETVLTKDIMEESLDKHILNGNRKANKNEKMRELVAYHESGHAIANYVLGLPIARVSIIGSTSGVGGFVMTEEDDADVMLTKSMIEKRIKVCYAGRVSEYIKFGADEITTGASNDIEKATNYIRAYVDECGFTGTTGLLNFSVLQKNQLPDRSITLTEMTTLSKRLEEETMAMLKDNYDKVENLVKVLLEKETISGAEVIEAIEGRLEC